MAVMASAVGALLDNVGSGGGEEDFIVVQTVEENSSVSSIAPSSLSWCVVRAKADIG